MGTRSTYRIREAFNDESTNKKVFKDLALVYVQYDGYPEGHPSETAEWLGSGKVVNGIGLNDKKLIFNGAGCLAAQMIARMKDGPGGVYLQDIKSRGKCWEEYLYDIIVDSNKNEIEFVAYENYGKRPKEIFRGKPENFANFVESLKHGRNK